MFYLISTPIGNVEDISLRAARTIIESPIVLAEDTRKASNLIKRIINILDIHPHSNQKIISYYKEVEFQKIPRILSHLENGMQVALVSDAGMPVISDPGFMLLNAVIREGFPYTVLPGPSAVETAYVHANFKTDGYVFVGFLPKKTGQKENVIKAWEQYKDVSVVFFESANRMSETLELLSQHFPEARMALCREMTKKYEEIVRGVVKNIKVNEWKGEITGVLYI